MEHGDLDSRLQDAAAADAALRGLDAELQQVAAALHKARSSEERWRRQAARAADALRTLRGFSLAAVWNRLVGRAAPRIAEHEASITEARREQEAIDARTAPLLARQAELQQRRQPLAGAAAGFAAALAAKEAVVRQRGGDAADRASASAAALARLQGEQRQLWRTLECAREAEVALAAARDQLGQARHLGDLDLIGGGLLVGSAKHAGLDVARGYLERARRALQHVAGDMGAEAEALAAIDLGAGLRLVDLLADGLVVDLLTGARIRDGHDRVRDFVGRLRDVILGLERQDKVLAAAFAAAADERARWLCGVHLD